MESRQILKCLQKGFLDRIFGVFLVMQKMSSEPEEPEVIAFYKLLECVNIPSLAGMYQVKVAI